MVESAGRAFEGGFKRGGGFVWQLESPLVNSLKKLSLSFREARIEGIAGNGGPVLSRNRSAAEFGPFLPLCVCLKIVSEDRPLNGSSGVLSRNPVFLLGILRFSSGLLRSTSFQLLLFWRVKRGDSS